MRRFLYLIPIIFLLYWSLKGVARRFFPLWFDIRKKRRAALRERQKPVRSQPQQSRVDYGRVRDASFRDLD
ncbi:MAG TPA: hypothetical protein VHI13_03995 [Candidatus Kapabacteria bacterium]|nr:hypothetical protein [Candidatus Kapabacteria bacterium]